MRHHYAKFGIITPSGCVVVGQPTDKTHEQIAKRVKITSLTDALYHGAVRWAVLENNSNLMISWFQTKDAKRLSPETKRQITDLITKEPTFVGSEVEFDIGGVGQYRFPIPKALQFLKSSPAS